MASYSPFYLCRAVQTNARVFQFLLRDLGEDSPQWDIRPDPERFSLREILAHLCDYDAVTRERFERILKEDSPQLPNWDEAEAARFYESRNPLHSLESLLLSRDELSAWLEGLSEKEWQRKGSRPGVGEFSIVEGVGLFIAHDAYHLEQITLWLDATK